MGNENLVDCRWGGALLALGFIAYALAVLLYVGIYGQPEGTGAEGVITLADRVSHLDSNWVLARAMWLTETVAAILIAIAGFVLQHRSHNGPSWISGRCVWVTVGVGGVLLFSMYPVMLGGYPEAARVFESEPGLFAVLNSIANFIFQVGNAVVFCGLAGVFLLESVPTGPLPRPLGITGAVVSLLGAAGALGLLLGIGAMNVLAPVGLAAFLLGGYLGIALYRTPPRELDPTPYKN